MIQLQAADAHAVKAVYDQVIQRRGQQDIAVRAGKGDVGGAAQFLAAPVFGEDLQSLGIQIEDVDRVWPVAGDPQPARFVKGDAV